MVTVKRVTADPRYPLAALVDLVEKPEDFEELLSLRALTDPVAVDALDAISLVAPADRYVGKRASIIMAPFLLMGESRWSPGTFGVLYTANTLDVAIRENGYHAGRLLRASHVTTATTVPRYGLEFLLNETNHADVRAGARDDVGDPAIYDPDSYAVAQALGASLRAAGRDGVCYDSVRAPGGVCFGTFRPAAVEDVTETVQELELVWDGSTVSEYRTILTHTL